MNITRSGVPIRGSYGCPKWLVLLTARQVVPLSRAMVAAKLDAFPTKIARCSLCSVPVAVFRTRQVGRISVRGARVRINRNYPNYPPVRVHYMTRITTET